MFFASMIHTSAACYIYFITTSLNNRKQACKVTFCGSHPG